MPSRRRARRRPHRSFARSCAAIDLGPADVAAAIDEIPVLCLAATQAPRHDDDPWRRRAPPQGVGPDRRRRRRTRARSVPRSTVDGDDLVIPGGQRLRGGDRGQPRRPSPRDDVRGGGPHRGRRRRRSSGPDRPPCPIPASSPTSKGCEHDQAGRPHRSSGRRIRCRARCSRRRSTSSASTRGTSSGIEPPIELADADRRAARPTTSSAPTSRSRTRSGSCRMVDRLTEEAHGDRRGQHDHARGQPARRPQHRRRRASRSRSTSSSGARRCPSRPWSSAPAAARGRSSTA